MSLRAVRPNPRTLKSGIEAEAALPSTSTVTCITPSGWPIRKNRDRRLASLKTRFTIEPAIREAAAVHIDPVPAMLS
jgi:hypothetical protein